VKKVGAGAVFRDPQGRVLLVDCVYKDPWEIPGGGVEAGESPREACRRELEEELGWSGELGRLLVVDWLPDLGGRGDRILFVFDGGVVDDGFVERVTLPPDELREARFVDVTDLGDHLGPGMVRRITAAIAHAAAGTTAYLEWGHPS
jgi:8-oxo-dGTP pyrophosphatase MutT (NUDIX family)